MTSMASHITNEPTHTQLSSDELGENLAALIRLQNFTETNPKLLGKEPLITQDLGMSTSLLSLTSLPTELQLHWLSYLRAYDLVSIQQTCKHYANPTLIHALVLHIAERVYPTDLTAGFDQQPLSSSSSSSITGTHAGSSNTMGAAPNQRQRSGSFQSKVRKNANASSQVHVDFEMIVPVLTMPSVVYYTLEHLRNMELLVVARVLSRPEPSTGFIVSKSWCKTALRWLEVQQEHQREQQQLAASNNKISKKKRRLRNRKMSDASPPWPNVNSDLLCDHNFLSRCSNSKSAKARRRIMDKQAWKILKKLYPDSTQLESTGGECVQCMVEAEVARKTAADSASQAKLERKQPLSIPEIRRFYTRTRGVPEHCLRSSSSSSSSTFVTSENGSELLDETWVDSKIPAFVSCWSCPLVPGTYHVLPRAWCHGWRKYIRTGETIHNNNNNYGGNGGGNGSSYPPPDAAELLCDAHRCALLPPHLEAFLSGQSGQLLECKAISIDVGGGGGSNNSSNSNRLHPSASIIQNDDHFRENEYHDDIIRPASSATANVRSIPGQPIDANSFQALSEAGMSPIDVARQLSAMRLHEQQQQQQLRRTVPAALVLSPSQKNEMLDRENHAVVEIVSSEEFMELEKLWPGTTVFSLQFTVEGDDNDTCLDLDPSPNDERIVECKSSAALSVVVVSDKKKKKNVLGTRSVFHTPICRDCDATGRHCHMSIKNRARNWVKRSSEKAHAPASLEY